VHPCRVDCCITGRLLALFRKLSKCRVRFFFTPLGQHYITVKSARRARIQTEAESIRESPARSSLSAWESPTVPPAKAKHLLRTSYTKAEAVLGVEKNGPPKPIAGSFVGWRLLVVEVPSTQKPTLTFTANATTSSITNAYNLCYQRRTSSTSTNTHISTHTPFFQLLLKHVVAGAVLVRAISFPC
jgi:hypothetical protein